MWYMWYYHIWKSGLYKSNNTVYFYRYCNITGSLGSKGRHLTYIYTMGQQVGFQQRRHYLSKKNLSWLKFYYVNLIKAGISCTFIPGDRAIAGWLSAEEVLFEKQELVFVEIVLCQLNSALFALQVKGTRTGS